MRFLAVDLGDRRTGLAIGDDETCMAHPITVLHIPIGDQLLAAIVQAIDEHEVDEIVMGLPLHMDGTPGSRVKITEAFGARINEAAKITIHYQDERLTSAAAEEHLRGSGKTHKQKKNVRDAIAATEILKDFLDSNQSSQ